tara:strand:- start:1790 stop:2095 length:306 start_codon:yes stop_codon:yes gene_type:complete
MTTVLLMTFALAFSGASIARAQTVTSGKVVIVAGDPGDFVVELDVAGSCGSKYFHVQRVNQNFKEMVAIALTAFSTGKTMTFFVTSCAADRNITSHGFVSR